LETGSIHPGIDEHFAETREANGGGDKYPRSRQVCYKPGRNIQPKPGEGLPAAEIGEANSGGEERRESKYPRRLYVPRKREREGENTIARRWIEQGSGLIRRDGIPTETRGRRSAHSGGAEPIPEEPEPEGGSESSDSDGFFAATRV
jgi:hypothetical protein